MNREIQHLPATLLAFHDVSLNKFEKVIETAVCTATRQGRMTELSQSDCDKLHQLDLEIWSKLKDKDTVHLGYLRKNEAYVLMQERAISIQV